MLHPVFTLCILALHIVDIEHSALPIEGFTPFSFPSAGISIVDRSIDLLLVFFWGFLFHFSSSSLSFITLSLSLFPFHRFQSRIPCPFGDQSRLRTAHSCISTFLRNPSAFYYQSYYPRDNFAAFTRSATFPQVSPLPSFPDRTIFYCVFTAKRNYYTTFPRTVSPCQVGKHVYLIAYMNRLHSSFTCMWYNLLGPYIVTWWKYWP